MRFDFDVEPSCDQKICATSLQAKSADRLAIVHDLDDVDDPFATIFFLAHRHHRFIRPNIFDAMQWVFSSSQSGNCTLSPFFHREAWDLHGVSIGTHHTKLAKHIVDVCSTVRDLCETLKCI